MILSQRQLEEIAASTTKDFNRFFFGDEADKPDRSALPTPIDQFAKNYLGLRVSFARLSPDGSICGVTAYADTEYKITELGITRTLALKRNQVILDESFILSGNVQRLCAKRRFTLAHECAHQILFQLESEEVKASCGITKSACTSGCCGSWWTAASRRALSTPGATGRSWWPIWWRCTGDCCWNGAFTRGHSICPAGDGAWPPRCWRAGGTRRSKGIHGKGGADG